MRNIFLILTLFTLTGCNGQDDYFIYPFSSIRGHVLNDVDGWGNGINGTGTNVSGQLYVSAITGGNCVAYQAVKADGSFYFNRLRLGTYSIVLHTSNSCNNASALPSGWSNVAEYNGTGTGNDGVINGICPSVVLSPSVHSNYVKFGIVQPTTYSVGGTVFFDNTTDGIVNGTGTNVSGALYVNLVNSANTVVGTIPVQSDGTYNFTGYSSGNYTVVLRGNSTPSTTASLPNGYTNTGESLNGVTEGYTDGIVVNIVLASNITNANFGIKN